MYIKLGVRLGIRTEQQGSRKFEDASSQHSPTRLLAPCARKREASNIENGAAQGTRWHWSFCKRVEWAVNSQC